MTYTFEEALEVFENVVRWKFFPPEKIWHQCHSCKDCANAVKKGETCKMYKPYDYAPTRTDSFALSCWVG